MLSFYGSVLSSLGTVILGVIAVNQSRQANHLSEKMLKLEESHELPIVDIVEVLDLPQQIPSNKYDNSLHLYLNGSHFGFNHDNAILFSDGPIAVFMLSNICSSHIISIKIENILQTTVFNNGARIETIIENFEYNGGVRILGRNETQYLLIGGAHFESPNSLTEKEILEQDYTTPAIELIISFQLGNTRGRKFCEKIKVGYTFIPSENNLNYPCILEKEILSIEEEK